MTITSISKKLESKGFRLVENQGSHILILPCLETPVYLPDSQNRVGEGKFTEISYDETDNSVKIKTEEGESCILSIRGEHLNYDHEFNGTRKQKTFTYEPDEQIIRTLEEIERTQGRGETNSEFITYYRNKTIEVFHKGGKHSEGFLPTSGVSLRILKEKYIKLEDRLGAGFKMTGGLGLFDDESKNALITPEVCKEKVGFTISIGSAKQGSYDSVNKAMQQLERGLFLKEFQKDSGETTFGDRKLSALGPNRKGEYLMQSSTGNSSVLICPGNIIKPWEGWVYSSTESEDPKAGIFTIREVEGGNRPTRRYNCTINFSKGVYTPIEIK